ncbi:MAG: class I adenylate-forming enzyme family protein [Dermatophilaceae bacterium]
MTEDPFAGVVSLNTLEFLLADAPDDAPALVDPSGRYTYGQLRDAVATVALALTERGVQPGDRVGVFAPNGLFYMAAYLAAMGLDAVAVPLSTTLGGDEVAARAEWVEMAALCLGRAQRRRAGGALPPALPLVDDGVLRDLEEGSWTSWRATRAPHRTRSDADASLMFTSGTTGRPRAVRLTHGNLQANTTSIVSYLGLRADERMLVILPFTYVFGASLLHTHLRVGACLVIQPSLAYPESVVEKLAAERCTGLAGVPSSFTLLLRNSSFRHRPLPDLRTIQQAGGKLPPVLIEELIESQPQAQVFIMYGQTEATARLSYLPPQDVLTRVGSIGRGIPGVRLQVLDEHGHPVVPGAVGEICATGGNVSPGYFRDPEATAERFPDGVLCTGDLGTVDEDGFIYVVDRKGDFIKSWGYRVSSQEVEAAAMRMPELASAAAVGMPDVTAGERVELVVVARRGSHVDEAGVKEHCRRHLPKNMVPEAVHIVDALPLNSSGKVVKSTIRDRLTPTHPASLAPTDQGTTTP